MGCYAPVKQEIEKKVEIKKEIKTKRETNKPLVWITPSKEDCTLNNGTIKNNGCKAKWSDANNLCTMIQARLPSIEELRKVVTDCGGTVNSYQDAGQGIKETNNEENVSYQNCYKDKNFTSGIHWSSSRANYMQTIDILMSYILFNDAFEFADTKSRSANFRCVKVD